MKHEDPKDGRGHRSADGRGPDSQRWGIRRIHVEVGDTVGGHYTVEGILDEGGMAVVYKARNAATGRSCALKILHTQLSARPEFITLFAKEAKVGSVIGDHDHIVKVYDAGLDEERGLPFIVMELLEGETLERALEFGPLDPEVARRVFAQLGGALEQAHRAGVVHRDLKPGNLFLTSDRYKEPLLKVMDFGIAKVLEGEVLRTATQIGTPAYTAPEQMGATTRKIAARQGITISAGVSPATDVWALGLLAYEIFTGLPPGSYWGAETLSELPMKVAFEDLPAASMRAGSAAKRLPAGFDDWFARCLRKNSDDRFPSAGDAVNELLALFGDDALSHSGGHPDGHPAGPPPMPNLDAGDVEVIDEDSIKTRYSDSGRPGARNSDSELPRQSSPSITLAARPPITKTEVPRQRKVLPSGATSSDGPVAVPQSRGQLSRPAGNKSGGMFMPLAVGALALAVGVAGYLAYSGNTTASGASKACIEQGDNAEVNQANCQKACDEGSVQGCAQLAGMYEAGDGVERDEERARTSFAKACGVSEEMPGASGKRTAATGDAARRWLRNVEANGCEEASCAESACASLARYYEDGRGGVGKNTRAATALYKRVCDVDFDDDKPRGVAGCVGLGAQREAAGQRDAARTYYSKACEGDVLAGCVGIAKMLDRGDERGQGRDEKRARELYQRACDGGELSGCVMLGRMVANGKGGWVTDEKKAVELYKRACEGGEQLGCTALAKAYLQGSGGLARDAVRAAELFQTSCEAGGLRSCAHLASMTQSGRGGLKRDEKRAYELNQQACKGSSQLGCAQLGKMFVDGLAGLTKDDKEGRALVDKACRGGEPTGCFLFAELEMAGGTLMGLELESLLDTACNDGEPRACSRLGELVERGEAGIEQDLDRAVALYQKACSEGAMRGCTNLANLTYQGVGGLDKDATKSVQLNDQACRGGDQVGCARLGLLYALGQGVRKDLPRAAKLMKGACSAESDRADSDWTESMQNRCVALKRLIVSPDGDKEG
jgi:TPR repeat protein/serine/threonine protein kinase